MSEIEELYNIARIPKYGKRQCKDSEYLECQKYCFCDMDNKCDKFVVEYPPFTAEKQIELIKWLSSKYGMYIVGKYSIGFGTCVGEFCTQKNFEEVLAESINHLWQSLTSEEKQQIKEILE